MHKLSDAQDDEVFKAADAAWRAHANEPIPQAYRAAVRASAEKGRELLLVDLVALGADAKGALGPQKLAWLLEWGKELSCRDHALSARHVQQIGRDLLALLALLATKGLTIAVLEEQSGALMVERDDWRGKALDRDLQVTSLTSDSDALRDRVEKLEARNAQWRMGSEALQEECNRLTTARDSTQSTLATLRQEVRRLAGALRSTVGYLRNLVKYTIPAGEGRIEAEGWAEALENDVEKAEKVLTTNSAESLNTTASPQRGA